MAYFEEKKEIKNDAAEDKQLILEKQLLCHLIVF